MKTKELFATKTVFSFEVFPPKKDMPVETVFPALRELVTLKPDFISVTCGAGGAGGSLRTVEVASKLKHLGCESVAHLPCINLDKESLREQLHILKREGIENILALRGDKTPGIEPKRDFPHASDLIAYIREQEGPFFNIIGACYPEGHQEAKTLAADIDALKCKVDAGANELISQLFFDNEVFYDFLDAIRRVGIHVPVEAGIMPVTNKKQIERMVTLCGATLPRKFQKILVKYGNDGQAMEDAGIAYAIDQIVDLLANGVDGIHIYTMNNPRVAKRIAEAVRSLL